jgi:hypothetical protein
VNVFVPVTVPWVEVIVNVESNETSAIGHRERAALRERSGVGAGRHTRDREVERRVAERVASPGNGGRSDRRTFGRQQRFAGERRDARSLLAAGGGLVRPDQRHGKDRDAGDHA